MNGITVKEHYVPKMILKNFSKDGKNIWQFDKGNNISRQIPYSTQCYEKNLYEFIGTYKGKEVNIIENELSRIEFLTNNIITDKIKHSIDLSEEEQGIIGLFTTLQLLRLPLMMYEIKKINIKLLENPIDADFVDRFSKISSLFPIISLINQSININFYWTFKTFLEGKKLVIYKSTKQFVLNGDCPIRFIPFTKLIYYPISPYECIAFVPDTDKIYMKVTDKFVEILNKTSFNGKGRFVYSYKKIALKDI